MIERVLKLNIGGRPISWITREIDLLNVVTACRECNHYKADKLLDEIGMALLAVPYAPNRAEGLILENKNILGNQVEFLKGHASKRAQLLCNQN